jgi:pimeloyl-ACP methyl ester carboxylesterase
MQASRQRLTQGENHAGRQFRTHGEWRHISPIPTGTYGKFSGATLSKAKAVRRGFWIVLACVTLAIVTGLMSLRGALTRPFIFPAPGFVIHPQIPGGKLISASDERPIHAYYAENGNKLVVFFHGNGEVMGSMEAEALKIRAAGFSVLLVEYPGYGLSSKARATETSIYRDMTELLEIMQKKYGYESSDMIFWGFSLGTGVAAEMATRFSCVRILLFAPFTSAPDVARHHFFMMAAWLVADKFDTLSKAAQIRSPTMIIHGNRDSVIPISMGETLAATISGARFMYVQNADHNDLLHSLSNAQWNEILQFIGPP